MKAFLLKNVNFIITNVTKYLMEEALVFLLKMTNIQELTLNLLNVYLKIMEMNKIQTLQVFLVTTIKHQF